MKPGALVFFVSLILALVAVYVGIDDRKADLMVPGILAVVVSAVGLIQSYMGRTMKLWVPTALVLALALGIYNAVFTDLEEFARFCLATPLFVVLAGVILSSLIAYRNIRLDRAMIVVYLLFLTLAVSNVFSYGVYYFIERFGYDPYIIAKYWTGDISSAPSEVMEMISGESNFWLVDEFAFAFVFGIIAAVIVYSVMRKLNIRTVGRKNILEDR
ncbi:MAG: hypothetical protein LBM39_03140 [Candidatus Methanoplasma sp.]|jgi:hypothetical protein|nr:hypothetical protein [Candidatus Methanoplasma sp.]